MVSFVILIQMRSIVDKGALMCRMVHHEQSNIERMEYLEKDHANNERRCEIKVLLSKNQQNDTTQ